jgi:hypothetical protein
MMGQDFISRLKNLLISQGPKFETTNKKAISEILFSHLSNLGLPVGTNVVLHLLDLSTSLRSSRKYWNLNNLKELTERSSKKTKKKQCARYLSRMTPSLSQVSRILGMKQAMKQHHQLSSICSTEQSLRRIMALKI